MSGMSSLVMKQIPRLPFEVVTVMLIPMGVRHRMEAAMGDKSLKSKQRDQKQRDAAKVGSIAVAKAKQESYMRVPQPVRKAAGKA